ncbi:MAG TPA: hypothetical protein PLU50_02760, partial [Pseudobdellovibrionaceae bacterium]|nr:hypothetical protein [Pseudobdellovibrionaceae bacterium]
MKSIIHKLKNTKIKRKLIVGSGIIVMSGTIIAAFQNCSGRGFQALEQSSRTPEAAIMGAPCLFGGQIVPNGMVIKGYKRSVTEVGKSCDDSANSRVLICSNGAIVGQNEFPNASCSMAQTQNASPCANFVGSGKPDITNGGTLVVFRATKATQSQSCANLSITLACNNGSYKTLTGESTSLSSYFSECQELQ